MAVRISRAGLPARPRLLAPALIGVVAVLVLGGVGISLYTDLLWFRNVNASTVFTTVLTTKLLLFVGFGLLMATLVGANITVAYRVRPPFRPMSLEQQNLERYRVGVEPYLVPVLLLVSSVFGLFAGLSAAGRWQTWLLWRNRTDFGVIDPQFKRDVSYYAMTYPFQRFVLGFLLTAIILSVLAAAATHYLFGGLRLQTVGEKVSPAARAHLSVLVGVIVLLKAVAYYFDRFGLAFSNRGVVQGASYTDINSVLPAKNILIGVAVICSLLFFANIVVRNMADVSEVLALEEPVIFNCTGLGARELFDDDELIPVRGQLVFMAADERVDYCTHGSGEGLLYMFPRADGILLGGTFERNATHLEPDMETTARIVQQHARLFQGMRI